MNSQNQKIDQEQKVQYEIPKVVCTNSSLQLMTKAYVLTASKIARERLRLPGKNLEKAVKKLNFRKILQQETGGTEGVRRAKSRV